MQYWFLLVINEIIADAFADINELIKESGLLPKKLITVPPATPINKVVSFYLPWHHDAEEEMNYGVNIRKKEIVIWVMSLQSCSYFVNALCLVCSE